jgi:hypothetical protein
LVDKSFMLLGLAGTEMLVFADRAARILMPLLGHLAKEGMVLGAGLTTPA